MQDQPSLLKVQIFCIVSIVGNRVPHRSSCFLPWGISNPLESFNRVQYSFKNATSFSLNVKLAHKSETEFSATLSMSQIEFQCVGEGTKTFCFKFHSTVHLLKELLCMFLDSRDQRNLSMLVLTTKLRV